MEAHEARDSDGQRLPRPLFRRAAIEHASPSLAGDVMLASGPSSILLVTVYCTVVAVAVSFSAAIGFLRRATDSSCVSMQTSGIRQQRADELVAMKRHADERELMPCSVKQEP
jgi:hypothetical protein